MILYHCLKSADRNGEKMEEEKMTAAKRLPAGWYWVEYDDGSGSLRHVTGWRFYQYDLDSRQFMNSKVGHWDTWCGPSTTMDLEVYKELAENSILDLLKGD